MALSKAPYLEINKSFILGLCLCCGLVNQPNTATAQNPSAEADSSATRSEESSSDQSEFLLTVASDFPCGSGKVQAIDQENRVIRLVPSSYPDRGWVCWWYVHVTGIKPGEKITVDVGEGVWATPDRASFSIDNKVWKHTGPGKRIGKRIVFEQEIPAKEAWFAWGPPFGLANAQSVVEKAAQSAHAKRFELCRTREGHPVPALLISEPSNSNEERLGIWVQARQHAWEAGSSWVCQGFIDWIVSNDPRAKRLREKATITVVPIMDVDNVLRGAGGKQQKPQDHNRDWSDKPHWPAVQEAQKRILEQHRSKAFDLFVDLHNPGPGNREPYYYVAPKELCSEQQTRNLNWFLAASQHEITGPLAFRGKKIASGKNYDPLWERISKNWVTKHTGQHVVAVTLETAWNTPNSNQINYQFVGKQLGLAMERYFRQPTRKENLEASN